ncbi:MAG: IS110 family transposase, partial [Flavobacteriales bacterium]
TTKMDKEIKMGYCIGIDVSKKRLDVDKLGKPMEVNNDELGITSLIGELTLLLNQGQLDLVLCEASGGYEQKLLRACHVNGIPIHLVHANNIKYFSRSKGIKAKTDKLDAKTISAYGNERKPEPDIFYLNETSEKIRLMLKRREQLIADKRREVCRLDKIENLDILEMIKAHIEWLDKSIKDIGGKLLDLKKSDDVKESHALLKSIPGIGDLLANYLIAFLPELGKLSHKALAALVGVAPFNHDSGEHQGKRFIQGGRSKLRQLLYMAAMTSIKWNMPLQSAYSTANRSSIPLQIDH